MFPRNLCGVVSQVNRLALEPLSHIINIIGMEISGSKKLLGQPKVAPLQTEAHVGNGFAKLG